MKTITILFVFVALMSCGNPSSKFSYIDLSKSTILDSAEVVYTFDDKYPVSVNVLDSLLYVIQIKSDTCMTIININTKENIKSFGKTGYGPEDLIRPNFILSTDESDVLIEDGNSRKIAKIYWMGDSVIISKYIEYPEAIFISSEMNISNNFIVGRKVDAIDGKMFYIYERNRDAVIEKEGFPKLNETISDLNYTYAPAITFNEKKNRIVAGMYFFDMFHLYDLTGKYINTFCFSDKCIPHVNKKQKKLDLDNGYSGIIRVFPTNDYCYLLRLTRRPESENVENVLIQIDWEGNLINSYIFKDNVSGQFYVDELLKKIYIIRNYMNLEEDELFDIVTYNL